MNLKTKNNILYSIIISILLLTPTVAENTIETPQLVVKSACEYNYPPFCIVTKDSLADGFSVELLRAALKAVDKDVTFQLGLWEKVKMLLKQGKVEALPLVGRTPEREAIYDFTFPYLSLHGAIVVLKSRKNIHNLSDLKGLNVAVMAGDNAEEFLQRKNTGCIVYPTQTFEDALFELSKGKHDAVVIQKLLALRLIAKTKITNLHIIDKPLHEFRQDFCFAVKEGDKKLLSSLNEGLALVMADGTFNILQRKWFTFHKSDHTALEHLISSLKNTGAYKFAHSKWIKSIEPSGKYFDGAIKHTVIIFTPLLLLLIFFIVWSRILSKQVESRTKLLQEKEELLLHIMDNLPVGIAVNSVNPSVDFGASEITGE